MLVRGAGFPLSDVLALAEPGLSALARLAATDPLTRPAFDAAFPSARERQRTLLRATASSSRFREAVTWQNRGAVVTGLDALLRHPERDDSRARKKELLVASYLQRYAAKCETIGFFGPVGWGRWDAGQSAAITATPGAKLLDARETFFEPWVVEAVVDALAACRELAELVPLRLPGSVRLERAEEARVIGGGRGPRGAAADEEADSLRAGRASRAAADGARAGRVGAAADEEADSLQAGRVSAAADGARAGRVGAAADDARAGRVGAAADEEAGSLRAGRASRAAADGARAGRVGDAADEEAGSLRAGRVGAAADEEAGSLRAGRVGAAADEEAGSLRAGRASRAAADGARAGRVGAPAVEREASVRAARASRAPEVRLRVAGEPEASEDDAALLSLADGKRHALALAAAAKRRWPARFPDEAQTVDALFRLVELGLLLPALPMTIEPHPARRLLAAAKSLAPALRDTLTRTLNALEGGRVEVASAAGDAAALGTALEHLEATFTALTGQAATRHEGRAYAGRALVYEETRRAGTWRFGENLRAKLAAPLALLLDAARTFTSRVAQGFLGGVERRFDALGGGRIPLDVLWRETGGLFDGQPPAVVAKEARALEARFAKAMPLDEASREQRFSSADVRRKLGRALEAKGEAWPGAKHHAPDVMLAVRSGEVVPVLGELHVGVTPFTTLSVLAHCPVRAELEKLYAADLPGPHVTPVPWEDFARSTHDARLAKDSTRWHVDLGFRNTSPLPSSRVLRVAGLVVTRRRGGLWVSPSGEGSPAFPLLHVLERRMKLRAASELHLFSWRRHRPRVWLDEVVVAREAWRVGTEALAWASSSDAKERFLGATAWALSCGFPRFVFLRSPAEVKPIYVDFESPTLVDLACKFLRGAPEVVLTEMLPAPDEVWLGDAEGQRYVCELRMVAVEG
ncbi:MAG: lantibiotic dehydratase [Myxococcales bacterium]|nr:lantibiotic dehydratase [Myxococcales bacterium]